MNGMNFYEVVLDLSDGDEVGYYLLAPNADKALEKATAAWQNQVIRATWAVVCENVRPEYQELIYDVFEREVPFSILLGEGVKKR